MLNWQIGDVKITQLVELTTASLGPYLLPQATPNELKKIEWMSPFVDSDHRLVLSMHMLVLEINDQTILVDTCIGNDKERIAISSIVHKFGLMLGWYILILANA